jgi:hypothetical protein
VRGAPPCPPSESGVPPGPFEPAHGARRRALRVGRCACQSGGAPAGTRWRPRLSATRRRGSESRFKSPSPSRNQSRPWPTRTLTVSGGPACRLPAPRREERHAARGPRRPGRRLWAPGSRTPNKRGCSASAPKPRAAVRRPPRPPAASSAYLTRPHPLRSGYAFPRDNPSRRGIYFDGGAPN